MKALDHPTNSRPAGRTKLLLAAAGAALLIVVLAAAYAMAPARVAGGTAAEKIKSICRLADRQPYGAADAVASAAADPDPAVRRAAMLALARFLDSKRRAVVVAGTGDGDAQVRATAAATLGLFADDDAVDRLGELARADGDERVRLGAVLGLRRARGDRGLARLVGVLSDNDNANVRLAALKAFEGRYKVTFGGVGDPRDASAWAGVVLRVRRLPGVEAALAALPPAPAPAEGKP